MVDLPEVFYYKFDFDNRVIIAYERDGECNQCGMCCKYVIRFKSDNCGPGRPNPIKGWDSRNGDFTLYHDHIVNAVYVNGHWRYFRDVVITDEVRPCSMLTADNKCRIHEGKTLLSRVWPMSPEQAEHFKECSYTFREIKRWTMDEWWGEGWDADLREECARGV